MKYDEIPNGDVLKRGDIIGYSCDSLVLIGEKITIELINPNEIVITEEKGGLSFGNGFYMNGEKYFTIRKKNDSKV